MLFALLLLAPLAPAHALDPAPADARLDRLLELTRARTMLEDMLPQVEISQQQMLAQLSAGHTLDADARARLDAILAHSSAALRQALAWDTLEPVYRQTCRRTFSAGDVDAIIAFYERPAGQRMLDRMPALMQHTMEAVQQLMMPMLEQMQRDIAAELSNAG